MIVAAGMLTACGSKKESGSITTQIVSDDGTTTTYTSTIVETIKGSGNMKEKTVDVPEGVYAFSIEGVQLVNSTINVNIVPGNGTSSIEVDDNVIDAFELSVDENAKSIKLTANAEETYQSIACTATIYADIDSIEAGGVAGISYEVPESVNTVKITAEGSSNITVSGECDDAFYQLSGMAAVNASELKAGNAEADVQGNTQLDVFASASLKISASGTSQINYAGDPETVDKDVSGLAVVNKK